MSQVSVQRRMATGASWMILLRLVDRSLATVSTLILVRVLAPEDFGMVAMATSFIVLAELISAFGFDVALIHRQDASKDHYNTAWTLNVLLGAVIFLVMLVTAAPIARFYNTPAVFWIVCALAIGPLIGGLENIGVVAFRKDLNFRREFAFQISRRFISFVVVVPIALLLRSYWALVVGMLVSRSAGTMSSYLMHPFRPRLTLRRVDDLLGFSKWLLINNVLGVIKERFAELIIGRNSGAGALGLYNLSYEFANLPTAELGAPLNRALLPGFAKLESAAEVRSAYRNSIGLLALVGLPAAAGLMAVSAFFIPVVLGTKWLAGVPLMQVLSISGAFVMFQASICAVLIAKGHPRAVTAANGAFVAILLACLSVLVPRFSALGAAYSVLCTGVATMPVYMYLLRKNVGLPFFEFALATVRPLCAAVVMVMVVRALLPEYNLNMSTGTTALWLAAGTAVGGVTYLVSTIGLWFAVGRPDSAEKLAIAFVRQRLPFLSGNQRP